MDANWFLEDYRGERFGIGRYGNVQFLAAEIYAASTGQRHARRRNQQGLALGDAGFDIEPGYRAPHLSRLGQVGKREQIFQRFVGEYV